ncbi:MAG TPA: TIGR00282 family metallophosphoesterase [Candidatus Andersenbacteria bacterium]|nr:TIGR00282 family metallophosphoesterase [Candidatus Andersenbacteria bacterium]
MKFLIFGDVVGTLGRKAITKILPSLREEYAPDAVIVNIENMAHGKGISPDTMKEALKWDAFAFTTGDHAWDNALGIDILTNPAIPIVRPANYPAGVPGKGYRVLQLGAYEVAIMNLQGQVFFKNQPNNPFLVLDEILETPEVKRCNIKLLDFHAETTSEKRGMGWYADGRISALWGTHTHVPTADAQILQKGTGYISDVGMNGAFDSSLGMEKKAPLRQFLTQLRVKMEPPETGPMEIGALFLEVDPSTGKTITIAQIRRILQND